MKRLLLSVSVCAGLAAMPAFAQNGISTQDAITVATSLLAGQPVDVRLQPGGGAQIISGQRMYYQGQVQPQVFYDRDGNPVWMDASGRVHPGYLPAQPQYYVVDDRREGKRRLLDRDDDERYDDDDDDDKRKRRYKERKNRKKFRRDRDDRYDDDRYDDDDDDRKKRKKRRDRDDDDDDDD